MVYCGNALGRHDRVKVSSSLLERSDQDTSAVIASSNESSRAAAYGSLRGLSWTYPLQLERGVIDRQAFRISQKNSKRWFARSQNVISRLRFFNLISVRSERSGVQLAL